VKALCPESPSAISFAFPSPADYPNGIIADLGNLPGFCGGVALGPMLEETFGIPVFINNDGDLFTYGEAIGGLLPHINSMLEKAGSPKRYQNLFGLMLGTGLGGGIFRKGGLFIGANSMAGEVWLLRNKFHPAMNAQEGACIRAVRRVYAELSATPLGRVPAPKPLYEIANGTLVGNQPAAVEAFRRLASAAVNLEDPAQLDVFLKGETRTIQVPGSARSLAYDPLQRVGVGMSRLGTSEAVAIGAYAFALQKLGSQ
jgi:glucokinase